MERRRDYMPRIPIRDYMPRIPIAPYLKCSLFPGLLDLAWEELKRNEMILDKVHFRAGLALK